MFMITCAHKTSQEIRANDQVTGRLDTSHKQKQQRKHQQKVIDLLKFQKKAFESFLKKVCSEKFFKVDKENKYDTDLFFKRKFIYRVKNLLNPDSITSAVSRILHFSEQLIYTSTVNSYFQNLRTKSFLIYIAKHSMYLIQRYSQEKDVLLNSVQKWLLGCF